MTARHDSGAHWLWRQRRIFRIWTFVALLLLRLWWDQQPWVDHGPNREERRRRRQQRRARWLLRELISMGATFIKLGQLLSARPDVLPPDYVEQPQQTARPGARLPLLPGPGLAA